MEDKIFFNQSKYIKEMLKKFGLEDSKPTKMPMSTEIKLTKDDEADSMDSSKYYEKSKMLFRSVKAIFRKQTALANLPNEADTSPSESMSTRHYGGNKFHRLLAYAGRRSDHVSNKVAYQT
ncbi:hypothetical protein Tco_0251834 [Tanacetum coccineum]